LSIERQLDEVSESQRYFSRLIKLEEMTKEDGRVLGADLVWDGGQLGGIHPRKHINSHVEEMCRTNEALKEVAKRYPWVEIMLKRARSGDLAVNRPQSTKLECIAEREARTIANNLMPCLKSRKTAKAGIEQWREQNRGINELLLEFPLMTDMFIAIGEGIVKAAPWGLMVSIAGRKVRMYALMSILLTHFFCHFLLFTVPSGLWSYHKHLRPWNGHLCLLHILEEGENSFLPNDAREHHVVHSVAVSLCIHTIPEAGHKEYYIRNAARPRRFETRPRCLQNSGREG